jgi:prepilin-type N-terminal cleavage/methylation domain-containing protein
MTNRTHTSLSAFRPRRRSAGFTMLEVIIAVMILGMTAIGIFNFVRSNLQAIRYSVEDVEETLSIERLVAMVQEELYAIPARGGSATLLGEGLRTNNMDFDSMEWPSRGGPGLMTTAATGEFRVKLMMKPLETNSRKYEIGLRRRPVLLDSAGGLVQGGSDKDATWVPLLADTISLRIRYWDPRLGQQLDSWRDQAARPSFIVLSILKEGETAPYEAVLTVPAALTQQ